jgi:nitrite reductase (NO-forming)
VYPEDSIGVIVRRNVQTTLAPSAGATIVEFKLDVPRTYTLVDHSIFRVAKEAIGQLVAEGTQYPTVFRIGK